MKYTLKASTPTRTVIDLDRDLNPQQRAVVEAPAGRLLVLAGAGTGKTRALTYRVARLVAGGCAPERVMLLTFTNRAAREMTERVAEILGLDMRRCAAGTFHHVAHRLVRKHALALGLSPDFTIIDPEDARDLLQIAVAGEGLAALTSQRFPQPKVIASMLSLAISTKLPLAALINERYSRFVGHTEAISRVVARYAAQKLQYGMLDFDDLLVAWHQLLNDDEHPDVAQEIREDYDHVLVDEYQDINALEGAIVESMAKSHGSLTCVGDDAQSIYRFRGADFQQIHGFATRHADAKIYPLTINYRSTPQILALANRSIMLNPDQHPKELTAVCGDGPVPAVLPLRDVYQQAEFVAQRVLELHHEQNLALREQAVLYRNHAHSLELQIELSRRQIPYSVRSGARFFEQAHIKDIVAHLRARENRRDALAWLRILRLWPGIGNQTAERVGEAVSQVDISNPDLLANRLEIFASEQKGRTKAALERFASFWREFSQDAASKPSESIELIIQRFYADYVDRSWDNAKERKEDLDHLAQFARRYANATEFLAELALVYNVSAENIQGGAEQDDRLVLSTIHQAKGLEWRVVIMLGLHEGSFPPGHAISHPEQLAEERRLFYVATTRAREELYLCYPIWDDGKNDRSKMHRASRFLAEVDKAPRVFERWEIEEAPADAPTDDNES